MAIDNDLARERQKLKMRRYRKRLRAREEGRDPDYYITDEDYLDGESEDAATGESDEDQHIAPNQDMRQPRVAAKGVTRSMRPEYRKEGKPDYARLDANVDQLTTNLEKLLDSWGRNHERVSSTIIDNLPLILLGGIVVVVVVLVATGHLKIGFLSKQTNGTTQAATPQTASPTA